MWKDVINLIFTTKAVTDAGDTIQTETLRQVFADKKSIKQSEFYQAASVGMKPEILFIIRQIDYNNEQLLEYEGVKYSVIRTFSKNGEVIELTCSRGVNNG